MGFQGKTGHVCSTIVSSGQNVPNSSKFHGFFLFQFGGSEISEGLSFSFWCGKYDPKHYRDGELVAGGLPEDGKTQIWMG